MRRGNTEAEPSPGPVASEPPDLVARVQEEVAAQIGTGSLSMRAAARRVAMSVATLRRRLQEEGTTFSSIADELRREMAERHLEQDDLTLSEIAARLAFSDVGSFGRAFKRWQGVSPRKFRASRRD
jgi:AraC-like DNA-binding protein